MTHSSTNTYGLGAVRSEPSGSPFKLAKRMPDWHPDAADVGHAKRQYLFPEEALQAGKDSSVPFPIPSIPGSGHGPNPKDPAHGWILGGPIPEPTTDPAKTGFTKLIRELAEMVRCYNASLYRLRRLHYYQKTGRDDMPRNPNGDPKSLPNPYGPGSNPKAFAEMVANAEADWADVNRIIDDFLDGAPHNLNLIAVDMVRVNTYIVSMRVVAEAPAGGRLRTRDGGTGGSSSSHVSISSAFSSISSN